VKGKRLVHSGSVVGSVYIIIIIIIIIITVVVVVVIM
jgi:hypothetical protein